MTKDQIRCVVCGRTSTQAEHAEIGWTRGVERGRTVWTCLDCSRRHLREIEGKLDSAWW